MLSARPAARRPPGGGSRVTLCRGGMALRGGAVGGDGLAIVGALDFVKLNKFFRFHLVSAVPRCEQVRMQHAQRRLRCHAPRWLRLLRR